MEHEDDFLAGGEPDDDKTRSAFEHVPVLTSEVVDTLGAVPAGVVLDATLGGGGHSEALLRAHDHIDVIAIDQDPTAVEAASERLSPFGSRIEIVSGRFDRLTELLAGRSVSELSGFLFDLGISSPQVDRAGRGFSYHNDGPLDMRMNPSEGRTAAEIINSSSERELTSLLRRFGDERFAVRIAAAIVARRPIDSTAELAAVVVDAVPASTRGGRHPARRTFQALRIAVNDELAVLERGLTDAVALLRAGGRGLVIAYHSGEDRIVKRIFAGICADGRDELPNVAEPPPPDFELLWRGAIAPTEADVADNPRAASARMRGIERRAAA